MTDNYQRFLLAACIWMAVRAIANDHAMMYIALFIMLLAFVIYKPKTKDGE